jgi:hypothetical protein
MSLNQGFKFGDTVRFAEQLVAKVKNLNKWNQMLNTVDLTKMRRDSSMGCFSEVQERKVI